LQLLNISSSSSQILAFTGFKGVKGMCMAIRNTRSLYAKQFKKISLLDKMKSNSGLKPVQDSIKDTVTISSKDKKILAKADFVHNASTGLDYYDSIFGDFGPNMPFIRTMARCFSSIFCKKISLEETVEKMNAYQKLSYIKDPKEFCQKAFEQIKNDFGYKDIDIPLVVEEHGDCNAAWDLGNCIMTLYTDISQKFDGLKKADIIEYLIHEFRHVRQTEMAYRTSPEKLLNALDNHYSRNIISDLLAQPQEVLGAMARCFGKSLEDFQKMLKDLGLREKMDFKLFINEKNEIFDKENVRANLDRVFGKLKPFRKGSVKYQKGLNYIEGERTYIPYSIDKDRYRKGKLEKEAFDTEQKWRSVVNMTL